MNRYDDELARLRAANPAPLEPDRGRSPAATATLARILREPIDEPIQVPSARVRSEDLGPSIKGVRQRLEDPASAERRRPPRGFFWPRTPSRVWRRLLIVGVGSVAVVAALLVFGTAGSGPSGAFAGWSAKPTAAAPGETANALARCKSRLGFLRWRGEPAVPRWKLLLTDTRGPFTAMILRLQTGGASAACLHGPTFASTEENSNRGGSMVTTTGRKASVMSNFPGSGPIQNDWQVHANTGGGEPYTFVAGEVGGRVTRLTLLLSDGRDVQATVGAGSFIAWWPGSSSARSARLTSASCVTTQKLAFFNFMKGPRVGSSGPAPARRDCRPTSR